MTSLLQIESKEGAKELNVLNGGIVIGTFCRMSLRKSDYSFCACTRKISWTAEELRELAEELDKINEVSIEVGLKEG